ncbi:MAG: hypothetical protein ACI9DF_004360 [Verrucomicrobiales bacterium]|jgi:hypothetical protein
MRRLDPLELDSKSMGNPFQHLVRAITYQQLSGKPAGTIFGRVKDLFPCKHLKLLLVLDLPEDSAPSNKTSTDGCISRSPIRIRDRLIR